MSAPFARRIPRSIKTKSCGFGHGSLVLTAADDIDEVHGAGAVRVKLAAAVVAQQAALVSGIVGQDSVLWRCDTFEDNEHYSVMLQYLQGSRNRA